MDTTNSAIYFSLLMNFCVFVCKNWMCEGVYFIQSRQIILDHITSFSVSGLGTYGPYCLPVFLLPGISPVELGFWLLREHKLL